MKDRTQNKIIILTIIFGILIVLTSIKIFGASEVPKLVEKDGYCKITYGENYDFSETGNYCYYNNEKYYFTEDKFRILCPRINLFNLKVYSNCFHKGDSR